MATAITRNLPRAAGNQQQAQHETNRTRLRSTNYADGETAHNNATNTTAWPAKRTLEATITDNNSTITDRGNHGAITTTIDTEQQHYRH